MPVHRNPSIKYVQAILVKIDKDQVNVSGEAIDLNKPIALMKITDGFLAKDGYAQVGKAFFNAALRGLANEGKLVGWKQQTKSLWTRKSGA